MAQRRSPLLLKVCLSSVLEDYNELWTDIIFLKERRVKKWSAEWKERPAQDMNARKDILTTYVWTQNHFEPWCGIHLKNRISFQFKAWDFLSVEDLQKKFLIKKKTQAYKQTKQNKNKTYKPFLNFCLNTSHSFFKNKIQIRIFDKFKSQAYVVHYRKEKERNFL